MSYVLTTSNGNPVPQWENQTSQTAGANGPVLIQDFNLIDKLAHFDRERIPERVVHAKGAGAHGVFRVTHDITHLTKAKFLSQVGKETPVFARFSTVGGEKGSADTARDPRGFAVKFYTEEGNWDMVGNNTPVFFIRDPSKFPDFIHTQKRNPQNNLKDANMFWDFLTLVPESIHQVTILFSDRGTPDGYRHMNGYSSHTLKLFNSKGEMKYVKWHFKTNQGIKNLFAEEADRLAGANPDYSTQDLFDAIARGDHPSWSVYLQVMDPKDVEKYRWNIFDVTKVWPHKDYPLQPVGQFILNRNPENYFAEVEQAAFSPSHVVPGIEPSEDRMLQGRLFSYPDTHRHRLGVNYHQLPINRPRNKIFNHHRDGFMAFENSGSDPNYEPNSVKPVSGAQEISTTVTQTPFQLHGYAGRFPYERTADDYVQAGNLYRLWDDAKRERFVSNIAGNARHASRHIQVRVVEYFARSDKTLGEKLQKALGL